MYYTCHWSFTTIVDAGHCSCQRSGSGNTSEQRCNYICYTLTDQFGIGMVTLSCGAISHHRSQKRLDGAENCYRKCRRDKSLDRLEIELRSNRLRHRQSVRQFRELGSDSRKFNSGELAQKHRRQCSHNQSNQRTRYLLGHLTPTETYHETDNAHQRLDPIDRSDILEIAGPLRYETGRHLKVKRETEEVLHLRGEDGQGNTACEAHHNRIWNELEYHAHLAHAHQHKEYARHDGSDNQSLHSVLAHDTGHNDDECTCRTADKEV